MSILSTIAGTLLGIMLLAFGPAFASDYGFDFPVKGDVDLSSSFCEFRPLHFHGGIDIRTGGKVGRKVYSPVNGYVWRIKYSYVGYGKAVYIRDNSGKMYVFGHLNGLNDKLEDIVKKIQLDKKSYCFDKEFKSGEIPIGRGELFGYSGQTGYGAPHIHFETRTPDNKPLNPLTNGFAVRDNYPPDIRAVGFVYYDSVSQFQNGKRRIYMDAKYRSNTGEYGIDETPFFKAPFGIMINASDRIRHNGPTLNLYRLRLYVDDYIFYETTYEQYRYTQTAMVDLSFDYHNTVAHNAYWHTLYNPVGKNYEGSVSHYKSGGIYDPETDRQYGLHKARIDLLVKNGVLAVIIIVLILSIFLEYRLSFWIMMGMAISFIGSFTLLPALDISINMISMFGFLVALGIVVDDAIVVGENVYEHHERGLDRMSAAIVGAQEVARPVTFSILTNIVAFMPVLFLPGVTGNYWWPLPAVVIVVLLFSLAEALFILPAHLGHIGKRSKSVPGQELHHWQRRVARASSDWINTRYRPFLDLCLRHRYVTLTASLTLLIVTAGYALSDHMGMILMPEMAADEIEAGVRLPVGTTHDQSAAVAMKVTEATHRMFEKHDLYRAAEGIKTNVRGQSFIDVEIVMKPPDERNMTTREVIELWREEIGDIEGVDQITFEAERGPGGYRPDINIDLSHADIDMLARASTALFERMDAFEATRDVNDNYDAGKSQLSFTLLPEGRAVGLTPEMVGRQVRDAFFGAIALRHLRGTNEVEVRVKLPEEEREDIRYLDDFIIRTPNGSEVPLLSVVEVVQDEAFRSIERRDGRRVITVSAKVEPKSAANRVLRVVREEVLPQLRTDFPGITWSFEGSQAEMRESTATLWGGFALAMGVVYALLAIAFGSYIQPLIVMMAIPFGIVGAVLGHIVLGYDLSLVSMMGVVAVSGVVVNGALILVHHANRNRQTMGVYDAIHEAGLRRFRPIVLTTLTTFGGLTPIILETSRQAYHLIPMAISLGFGIIFATSITLVVVPCLYLVTEDLLDLVSARRREESAPGD